MHTTKRPMAFREAEWDRRLQPERMNTEQLRSAIDHGQTGDKIEWPDPAAAPLGTDEEAAGTPVPPHAVGTALRSETARHSDGRDEISGPVKLQTKKPVTFFIALTVAIFVGLMVGMYATL